MAKKRKIRTRRSWGTLASVATLLILSALVRLSEHAGQAFAVEPEEPEQMVKPAEPAAARPDIDAVLAALSQREDRVEEGERQIRLRMAALQEAEIEIETKINQLKKAEASLRDTLALADQAAENDLARLTVVYENMKPKDAAALFETMEPGFAAGFLGRMKPAAAAGIMTGLTPETAYSISAYLAGRNAQVPKE